jgi:hypothetical protein
MRSWFEKGYQDAGEHLLAELIGVHTVAVEGVGVLLR